MQNTHLRPKQQGLAVPKMGLIFPSSKRVLSPGSHTQPYLTISSHPLKTPTYISSLAVVLFDRLDVSVSAVILVLGEVAAAVGDVGVGLISVSFVPKAPKCPWLPVTPRSSFAPHHASVGATHRHQSRLRASPNRSVSFGWP